MYMLYIYIYIYIYIMYNMFQHPGSANSEMMSVWELFMLVYISRRFHVGSAAL